MQTITQKTLEDTLYHNDIPIFIYKIDYPAFTTSCSTVSAQIINEHYSYIAKSAEVYCRTVLFSQAVENTKYIQDGRPFNSYTFNFDYTVTYNAGCITSLYIDTYTYMGGAHGETKRTSDTWDFKTGSRIRLDNVYPFTPIYLNKLEVLIEQQIAERLKASPGSYFDNYATLLQKSFNSNNFYLKEGSGVIYFQQYDIAPYSTGLPEFTFPLSMKSMK